MENTQVDFEDVVDLDMVVGDAVDRGDVVEEVGNIEEELKRPVLLLATGVAEED